MMISRRAFVTGLAAIGVAPAHARHFSPRLDWRTGLGKLEIGHRYMVAITPDSKFVRVRHPNGRRVVDVPIAAVNLNDKEPFTIFGHDPFPAITHEWQTLTLVN